MGDIAAARQKAADDAWLDASTKVDEHGKRVSVLDEKALRSFPQEYQKALDAFKPKWDPLVQAHASWLQCELLSDWMAGVTDTKDLRSGYAYSESCAQAIGAAAGTDACTKVLNDWLAQPRLSNTRHLYARALLFSHDDLMTAADAQIHGSDIQYEAFMNIYKNAHLRLETDKATMSDRILVTTANTAVKKLTTKANDAGLKLLMIRLHVQGGVAIKVEGVDQIKLQKWVLDEAKAQGIEIEGNRVERRQAAAQAAKDALKTASANPSVALFQFDTDTLERTGRLDAGAIKTIKVPGTEVARKWLGSAAPSDFNLGVVTSIVQLATFTFALKDLCHSDQFNHDDNLKKFRMCLLSMAGNFVETISGTVKAFEECPHPLSAYIKKDWSRLARFDKAGVFLGRGMGAVAGVVLAWSDLFTNTPEAWNHQRYGLSALYAVTGGLGVYVAIMSIFGSVPAFWPVFILSIAISIGISKFKDAAVRDWTSHCEFSMDKTYSTLTDEVSGFNTAM